MTGAEEKEGNMTDAQRIAERFNFLDKRQHGFELDDGFFEDGEFQIGDDEFKVEGDDEFKVENDFFGFVTACPSKNDVARWEFNDGSSLVIFGEEWGFGFTREELESDHVKKLFADIAAHPLPAAFTRRQALT